MSGIQPKQVSVFVQQQYRATVAAAETADLEQHFAVNFSHPQLHVPPDRLEEMSRQHVLELREAWSRHHRDLHVIDGTLAHLDLGALIVATPETVEAVSQVAEKLSGSEHWQGRSLDDTLKHAGVSLPPSTRQLLLALLFAHDKPVMLEALVRDDAHVQPYLDQLRDSLVHPELFTVEQAQVYLEAAKQHAADSLAQTLPLLRGLPAQEKAAVRQVLGEGGLYFGAFSPDVGAQLLAALQ